MQGGTRRRGEAGNLKAFCVKMKLILPFDNADRSVTDGEILCAGEVGFGSGSAILIAQRSSGLKGFERKVYMGVMSKLEVGDPAPEFKLQDQKGEVVRLSDFTGRKVLVFFYPKADTPGCTTQSCSVSESLGKLTELGTATIGISPDRPEDQLKFDEKFSLGFPLLADCDHAVAEAYGVWGEKSMYGNTYMGIIRSSFLIDEEGSISSAWYKVSPKDTVPKAIAALKKSVGR